jgi:hypothetical protein
MKNFLVLDKKGSTLVNAWDGTPEGYVLKHTAVRAKTHRAAVITLYGHEGREPSVVDCLVADARGGV